MYSLRTTSQFEKDYKLCKARGLTLDLIHKVFEHLSKTGTVPVQYKPHKLKGKYSGFWECHIQNDWLLIWLFNNQTMEIHLTRTGTHSDLF